MILLIAFVEAYFFFMEENSHFFLDSLCLFACVCLSSRYMAYIMDTNEEERVKVGIFILLEFFLTFPFAALAVCY